MDDCCDECDHVAPRGVKALYKAWRRADLRPSNVRCQRKVTVFVQ